MQLSYTISGSGTPTILLHGFISQKSYWQHFVRTHQNQNLKFISIDLLGFGKSPKPKDCQYTLEDHASAVIQCINQILGKREPYILVGHSMGALISTKIAELEKTRVKKLILYNMPVLTNPKEFRDSFSKPALAMTYWPSNVPAWPLAKIFFKTPLVNLAPKKFRRVVAAADAGTNTSRQRSFKNSINNSKGIDLLAELSINTDVYCGLHDRAVYIDNLEKHKALIPHNVKIHKVDCNHHIPIHCPECFNCT